MPIQVVTRKIKTYGASRSQQSRKRRDAIENFASEGVAAAITAQEKAIADGK